ncbi:hypothetical protein EV360DRAFT_79544 [Lentinula raphanica]|nr:hypothetical protein EV360DRAFT_79544 [Lentinula raphanica]
MSLKNPSISSSPRSDELNQVQDSEAANLSELSSQSNALFDYPMRYIQWALRGLNANDIRRNSISLWTSLLGSETRKAVCVATRLPLELLREIFLYLAVEEEHRGMRPRLPISQVCRYWRYVAITYPKLWSTIKIYMPTEGDIHLTKLWLERARQHPLTVYVEQWYRPRDESHLATEIVMSLLLSRAHRWKTATFILASGFRSSFLALPRMRSPLLETLRFDTTTRSSEYWGDDALNRVKAMISSSVSLRHLTVKAHVRSHSLRSTLPTNLTYLCGDFTIDLPFLLSLSTMEQLQTLRLHGCLGRVGHSSDQVMILPCLHSLDIQIDADKSQFLFNHLEAPNLKALSTKSDLTTESQMALCSFIERSHCQLEAFAYGGSAPTDDSEPHFFERLFAYPQMMYLSELIVFTHDPEPVMSLLARRALPSLNRLFFNGGCSAVGLHIMLKQQAGRFLCPSDSKLLEPLFDDEHSAHMLLFVKGRRNQEIPISQFSLCIQVKVHGSACEVEELTAWCKNNERAHWSISLLTS